MREVTVGELYDPARRHWAPIPIVRITHDGIELALMTSSPTDAEVRAVQSGTPRFAWIDAPAVALLAWTFGEDLPWTDAPYSPHLENPGERAGIGPHTGAPASVSVVLVDADTGLVRVVRTMQWSPEFVVAVRDSVDRMATQPVSMSAIDASAAALYITYPDTAELVEMKATAICDGGKLNA
ncbi:hypothetical protein [Nocardia sp. NBC_01388]|uniref:hypothetical protein n=1 Tax=Nocardia sp. NBC_01388 TaxID=2903596 RepID=UPI00324DDFBA